MAYRRKQQGISLSRHSAFQVYDEEDEEEEGNEGVSSNSSSLAAKAIRASSAHRDSSLSSAYANPTRSSSPSINPQDPKTYQYTSMKSLNESKHGFWGSLARKAKAILDDDNDNVPPQQIQTPRTTRPQMPVYNHQQIQTSRTTRPHMPVPTTPTMAKDPNTNQLDESSQKTESPTLQKGLGAITSSLSYIGGTIGNALEEGLTIMESRTADIIQETRKHIRKKPSGSEVQNQVPNRSGTWKQPQLQPQMQTDQELQLKASRDVAMAMAAKAKLLLRELKTIKADLAFAKERCAQLEEENKSLRENRERRHNPADDDLIRLQLETLLAEKARLAHENSVYARENRFLREIVEYHQLTMQDVVYFNEDAEEVSEVYPINVVPSVSNIHAVSTSSPPPLSS